MKSFKKFIYATLIFIFPIRYIRFVLSGHYIEKDCKIGFSWLYLDKIVMKKGSSIGSFNYVDIISLELDEKAWLGTRNIIRGSIVINIGENGTIEAKNKIYRANIGTKIIYGISTLKIGVWGQIVHGCIIDCTRSIFIGNYTTIGGTDTQMWTHGYYHANVGIDRVRIDGEIYIGNNVYVGSRCTFMPGVRVADGVHIGGNCCISKSLDKPGMYVSQPLRFIDTDINKLRNKLNKVEGYDLAEEVYEKKI